MGLGGHRLILQELEDHRIQGLLKILHVLIVCQR